MSAATANFALKFSDLDVWKISFGVSLDVHRETLNFPRIEQFALADQMRRASKSICANIAEGFSRQRSSKAEFKRFVQMALASGNEMLVWILYCGELGYVSKEKAAFWSDEYDRICRMLNTLHAKS